MSVFDNHHAPSESCNCDPNHTVYMSPEGFAEHIAALAWDEGFKNRHSEGQIDPNDPSYTVYGPNPYRPAAAEGNET